MAEPVDSTFSTSSSPFDFDSHDTALCIIPPQDLWPSVDRLRALYDKGHGSWPPHINLIYPFVKPHMLPKAADVLSQLDLDPIQLQLDSADRFSHRRHNTIFLRPSNDSGAELSHLQAGLCSALGHQKPPTKTPFRPHMTVAQSEDAQSASHKFLAEKVRLLAPVAWNASQIAVLVRDTSSSGDEGTGSRRMRLWGTLDIPSKAWTRYSAPRELHDLPDTKLSERLAGGSSSPQPTYHFNEMDGSWQVVKPSEMLGTDPVTPERLVVASYNVLAEFEWPPQPSRYPGLIENLLSERALADILVLEEVTDHFLPFLLANPAIRSRYPFATYGPPDQPDVGPLPSLLNVAVLSKFPFQWEYLPLQRKHKACAVVIFPTIGTHDAEGAFMPLVVTACHLSQGLVDGAVVAKKNELQRIIDHLSSKYSKNAWILAGDFNIATSSHTIDASRRRQDISSQTVQYLRDIDILLLDAGFQDTWLSTRLESGESSSVGIEPQSMLDSFEGEQGATFDPIINSLASSLVGTGLNNRPQRYDRILLKAANQLHPQGFNMFGQVPLSTTEDGESTPTYASDHWGIRCLLTHSSSPEDTANRQSITGTPVKLHEAPPSLQGVDDLKDCLSKHDCLPTDAERQKRELALEILQRTLLDSANASNKPEDRAGFTLVLAPVGSYGLGVWTSSSDIDCLCIGTISTKTFFALALQRLRRAASEGVSVLRRVRANSGYMLELEVQGIKVDLQYCSATSIVERWPDVMKRPSQDPVFALPMQTLSKLKPLRDLFYLRRSIPDMTQYRLAHLLVKAWAKARGIYSSRFGFLGGIHISALLVPICKMLAAEGHPASTGDVIATFFHHYAEFDWKSDVVVDPFFHKTLRYHRTFREPLCLLGWHGPSLNTAATASVPTVKTISTEFKRASALLRGANPTWNEFFGSTAETTTHELGAEGAAEFLKAYRNYVKIDAHFWGSSPESGNRFVGWLESRCVMLLVDIDRKIGGILARIWPARFVEPSADSDDTGTEYHTSYLVGLEWHDDQPGGASKEQARSASVALQNVLQGFEERIRGDEKYYDANVCYMTATMVRGSELDGLVLDHSRWGENVTDTLADDSDDDELDLDEEDTDEDKELLDAERVSGKGAAASRPPRSAIVAKPAGLGKFRTAADVLNRLRWDANLNTSDYIVGYEDRFTGARERPVEQWKSEQTDEEFIPQHRILYFKRKTDGVILWERRSRIDDIFGSGVKAAPRSSPETS